MKQTLTFILFLTYVTSFGQILKGRLIDKETGNPRYERIYIKGFPKNGYHSDINGFFQIRIKKGDSLIIASIGNLDHCIYNIKFDSDTIDIGDIPILACGFEGYVTSIKNGKLKCRYVNTTQKTFKSGLSVKCLDGSIKFKWVRLTKYMLITDFANIHNCQNE